MLSNLTKRKKVLIVASSIILILAILSAVIIPILLNNQVNVGYSYEDENKPINYNWFYKRILYEKVDNFLAMFLIKDKKRTLANGLLTAMGRARIPTEKMLAFADYIIDLGIVLIQSGFSPEEGEFLLDKEEGSLFNKFNFYFKQFFEKTGFTEQELGRFLYELIADISAGSLYGDILQELGRADFVEIISNTIYCYNVINQTISVGNINIREARIFQGMVYSLGRSYLNMINKIGFNGVEKLLGLNFDTEKEYSYLNPDEKEAFINVATTLRGKVSNILFLTGRVFTLMDGRVFEQFSKYINSDEKDDIIAKESLVLAHIEISKAFSMALSSSFNMGHITDIYNKEDFIQKYSTLLLEYAIFLNAIGEDEDQQDIPTLQQQFVQEISYFIESIELFNDLEDIAGVSKTDLDSLFGRAEEMWEGINSVGQLVQNSFSIVLLNFFLRAIDIEKILDENKNILEDLFS